MKRFALAGLIILGGCSAAGADIDDAALNKLLTQECMSKIEQNLSSSEGGVSMDFEWDYSNPDNVSAKVDRQAKTFSIQGQDTGHFTANKLATVDVDIACEGKFDYSGSDSMPVDVSFTSATEDGTFQ